MPTYAIPAVYDAANNVIRPANANEYLSPTNIRIVLKNLISLDDGNVLRVGTDNKFFVRNISKQAGNLLELGNDFGASLVATNILSGGNANLLTVDASDLRIILTREQLVEQGFVDNTGLQNFFKRHKDEIIEQKEAACACAEAAEISARRADTDAADAQARAADAAASANQANRAMNQAATYANTTQQIMDRMADLEEQLNAVVNKDDPSFDFGEL